MKTLNSNTLKIILILLLVPIIFTGIHAKADDTVTSQEIALGENIAIVSSLNRYETISRKSAVKIETPLGSGSGTYFNFERRYVVITAAHVIGDFEEVTILGRGEEKVKAKPILIDQDNDFAVLLPESPLKTRNPAKFKISKKSAEDLVGKSIFYTGFPSLHDLLTLKGSVSGTSNGYLILQSYAWKGASGSGVFDSNGNFVGVLTGVDIGQFDGVYHLIPSIVWIVPINKIDQDNLKLVIKSEDPV
jgi:S1-C subfamily serine protease|tara:strand:- start:1745 stop:2485 length:741 start_codon:yes stop_codon:yes gene_type:complete